VIAVPAKPGRSLAAEDHELAVAVGQRIRAERHRLGLTQLQVAAPRYTKAYISALENGLAKPSIAALGWVSGKVGVSIAALLPGESDRERQMRAVLERMARVLGSSVGPLPPDYRAEMLAEALAALEVGS
jgi:transcriptional regulator with XRE-family HTH domain